MSEQNVETVQRIVRAFEERDGAAAIEPLDPRIEWDMSRIAVDDLRGVYHGIDGVATFWRGWLAAWRMVETGEPKILANGDRVLSWFADQRNVGKRSGIEVRNPEFGLLYTFHDGKIIRVTLYVDKAEALEAAGLPAQLSALMAGQDSNLGPTDQPDSSPQARDTARAMSEQNIEVVRHFLEAVWDRRDFEAARQLADTKLELDWSESRAPYAGKVSGFEAAIRWFTDVAEAFVGYGVERRSFTDCGPALVAVEQSISGRGRDSGIEVKATGTTLWRVRDGQVVSGKLFQTRAEALEAAGLSE